MTATLKTSLSASLADLAFAGSASTEIIADLVATSHELVDRTPRGVATLGGVGAAFVALETPVKQVERILGDFATGTDVVVRLNGSVAVALGSLLSAPGIAGGEQIVLNIDGAGNVTTTLVAGDVTIALVAKRINYYHGAQVASVDATGVLRIAGTLTGGADAKAKGYGYGSVIVVSGSGLAGVGLTAGTTYGAGTDLRKGSGLWAESFPSTSLPTKLELSGSATASRFIVAGKAS